MQKFYVGKFYVGAELHRTFRIRYVVKFWEWDNTDVIISAALHTNKVLTKIGIGPT